MQPNFSIV